MGDPEPLKSIGVRRGSLAGASGSHGRIEGNWRKEEGMGWKRPPEPFLGQLRPKGQGEDGQSSCSLGFQKGIPLTEVLVRGQMGRRAHTVSLDICSQLIQLLSREL